MSREAVTLVQLDYTGPPGMFHATAEIAGEPTSTHGYERASEALHALGLLMDEEHERQAERRGSQ